jgi:hypothetical protein
VRTVKKTAMKLVMTIAMLWSVTDVPACTLSFLGYEPVFESGRSVLSAKEVLRLASWKAEARNWLPRGADYYLTVPRDAALGEADSLAGKRLEYLRKLMSDLGVVAADIKETHFRGYQPRPPASRDRWETDTASIDLDPRCAAHGCCAYCCEHRG